MRTTLKWLHFFWACCLLACAGRPSVPTDKIVVEGNISHIPDGKIYLIGGYSHKRLDSTACRNGQFRFVLTADSAFIPSLVSIQYKDSLETRAEVRRFMFQDYKLVSFRNYTRGVDSLKYSHSGFMLEKGYLRMTGDAAGYGGVRVFGSPETTVLYSLQMQEFGWLANATGTTRATRINSFKQRIKDNPFSYYLLDGIYNGKEDYSEAELREILGLFQPDVQRSAAGRKVVKYLANRVDTSQAHPALTLADPAGQLQPVFDPQARLTMLVFWASWCGPCRKEIPQLKALQQQYAGRGLKLVSVSIDEKPENWQQALGQEQMLWQQLLVEKSRVELIKQRFNFSSIPCVIFVGQDRKEVKRISGYAEANPKLYQEFLNKELTSTY